MNGLVGGRCVLCVWDCGEAAVTTRGYFWSQTQWQDTDTERASTLSPYEAVIEVVILLLCT